MNPTPTRPTRLLTFLSSATFALSVVLARGPLGGIAHVQDEQAYLLLARLFSRLWRFAPTPADGPLMAGAFQVLDPQWYAIFPPGWPAVLALGAGVGLPWLVNPLIAASLPWLCWSAFSEHLTVQQTRFACGIAALSPGIWTLGGSMMSHTLVLAAALLAAGAALSSRPTPTRMLAGGLALSVVALARPYDAVLIATPLTTVVLISALRHKSQRALAAAFVLSALAGPLLMLLDNAFLTGSPWLFPADIYFNERFSMGCNRPGLGPGHGCGGAFANSGHTLAMAQANFSYNAKHFDKLFLGFSLSGLLVLPGLFKVARSMPALLLIGAAIPLGYALYWYHGVCFGARFWHPVYLLAIPSAGCTIAGMARLLGGQRWLCWSALVLAAALQFGPIMSELSDQYWCVDKTATERILATGLTRGVVVLEHRGRKRKDWPLTKARGQVCKPHHSVGVGLTQNDPFGNSAIVWLRTPRKRSEYKAIAQRHRGKPLYHVTRNLKNEKMTIRRWNGNSFDPEQPVPR